MDKPPIGIVPRFILAEKRIIEINEAILRYLNSNCCIPVEWIKERDELIKYLRERNAGDD